MSRAPIHSSTAAAPPSCAAIRGCSQLRPRQRSPRSGRGALAEWPMPSQTYGTRWAQNNATLSLTGRRSLARRPETHPYIYILYIYIYLNIYICCIYAYLATVHLHTLYKCKLSHELVHTHTHIYIYIYIDWNPFSHPLSITHPTIHFSVCVLNTWICFLPVCFLGDALGLYPRQYISFRRKKCYPGMPGTKFAIFLPELSGASENLA